MIRYNNIITLLFCLSANVMLAQSISAKIIGEDGHPIPMAHVRWQGQQQGTVSNEAGFFSLPANEKSDSILISAIGFNSQCLPANKMPEEIKLKEQVYILNEIAVRPGGYREVELGFIAESLFEDSIGNSGTTYSMNDMQLARLIENPTNEPVQLLSASFYIGKKGVPNTPFKLYLYHVNEKDGSPGIDLLKEPLIVQADVKHGWYEIDLSDHELYLPPNGCFVTMEWFHSKKFKKYLYKQEGAIKIRDLNLTWVRHQYGQTLGQYRIAKEEHNWAKCCNENGKFRKFNSLYTPMIKVKALLYTNELKN